jgi:hypothetical protein
MLPTMGFGILTGKQTRITIMILKLTYSEVIKITDWESQVKTFVTDSKKKIEAIAIATNKANSFNGKYKCIEEEADLSIEALPDEQNQTKAPPNPQIPSIFRFTVITKYELSES